jgi:hypothetical protein
MASYIIEFQDDSEGGIERTAAESHDLVSCELVWKNWEKPLKAYVSGMETCSVSEG